MACDFINNSGFTTFFLMTTFEYVLFPVKMLRELGQSGDKSSSKMVGVQNLKVQTAYQKFQLGGPLGGSVS